jgi:undecaprenyl-diphosphatase
LFVYGRAWLAAIGLTLALGFSASVLALMLFAALASEVAEGETLAFDRAVLDALRQLQSPALDAVMTVLSALGSEVVGVMLVVLLGWFAFQRRWGLAAALLLITGGAQVLNSILKGLFQRTRPSPHLGLLPGQSFSFPSGHAMVSAAFYVFLAYLGWRVLRGGWRVVWVGLIALLVLLIGLSRMYLGVHYPTDVLAGYAAGFVWVHTVLFGERLLQRARRSAVGEAGFTRTPPSAVRER